MADRYACRHGTRTAAAASDTDDYGDLCGGLFRGAGGAVLVVTYEDTAGDVAYRLRTLAGEWWKDDRARNALKHVHVLAGAGPLFGPAPSHDGEGPAFYNARPGPLDGWTDLWRGAAKIERLRLVVVDPAMAAYVGDSNSPGPVREFYGALCAEARGHNSGVLLVCHTNKMSRRESRADRDLYAPDAVAGSTHWTDAARGVMTLDYNSDEGAAVGDRVLFVNKANYGPSRMRCDLKLMRDCHGEICGFVADGNWQTEAEHRTASDAGRSASAADRAGSNVFQGKRR